MGEEGFTDLEGEAARLCGLGEVFSGSLLVVCVELDIFDVSAFATSISLKHEIEDEDGTSRSSSLLGFALSLRESSTAFLKAAV